MDAELSGLLLLAFSLGMLHALDADHIIVVSGLGCRDADKRTSVLYCLRWAVGHGSALLLIGAAVILLGLAVPERLSAFAENAVGVVLVLLGLWVLWGIYRQHAHLHFHHHDGLPRHAHWHSHKSSGMAHHDDRHQHSHAPVFIGILHGVAGSAPLLALLPLTQLDSAWMSIVYLLFFGVGVFMSMLIFGGLLGQLFGWLQRWGSTVVNSIRVLVSLVSIAYGISLLQVAQ